MLKSSINIGNFDFRLVIQQNTISSDAVTNEPISSWSTLSTVWAKRTTNGGREGFEADQEVNTKTEIFLIRYSSDVASLDSTFRVYENGTTDYYYVTLVETQKREGWIKITAQRKDG